MRSILTILALFGLTACSNSEVLATPKGPVFALNTGHWQPSPADLQPPKIGGPQ
jgi:hypothetical protein